MKQSHSKIAKLIQIFSEFFDNKEKIEDLI